MFSFRLVPGWLFALALNAVHQFDETWILVHVGPVWIRLKPLVIFISETDRGFQPSQCLDLAALQEISGSEPVRDIVIRLRDLSNLGRELFVGPGVLSLRAQTDRENRSHAIDLRMALQDLLKNLDSLVD